MVYRFCKALNICTGTSFPTLVMWTCFLLYIKYIFASVVRIRGVWLLTHFIILLSVDISLIFALFFTSKYKRCYIFIISLRINFTPVFIHDTLKHFPKAYSPSVHGCVECNGTPENKKIWIIKEQSLSVSFPLTTLIFSTICIYLVALNFFSGSGVNFSFLFMSSFYFGYDYQVWVNRCVIIKESLISYHALRSYIYIHSGSCKIKG